MKSAMLAYIGSKSPSERSVSELELLLPWFRIHGKGVLHQAADDVLIDVLRNCVLKSYKRNELIIMQGDFGDKFFVVVYGEVHVYVNDSMEPFLEKSLTKKSVIIDSDSLTLFGKCVASEDEGYSFGEYALLDEKSIRKASVIAAKEADLLVISRETYNESLKNLQQNIIKERETFINNHPLFSDWNPRMKNLLLMSLKKVSVPYQFNMVTQGNEWKGLYFVVKGSGKITIDPDKHETSFPQFFPLDFDVYDKRYQEFPELKPPKLVVDLTEAEAVETLMPKRIRLKRAGNYAALESYVVSRKNYLCSIQSKEIIGDLEFIFSLKSNLYTVVAIEHIDALHLDLANLERISKRLNTERLKENLSQIIKSKMNHREKYFKETPIPLMLFLKIKLYDKKLEIVRPLPKLKTEKKLPSDSLEWQHQLKMFIENKASLCKPFVKGGIFLRDLMNKNFNLRSKSIPKKFEEIAVKSSNDTFSTIYFPVSHDRVSELQKIASSPMQLLEMLYSEIYSRGPHKSTSNKNTLPDNNYKEKSHSIFFENNETLVSKPNSESMSINQDSFLENNSKQRKNFVTSAEYFALLQKSQIEFLNSLCSEKSCYEIKMENLTKTNEKNSKVHFLPSLQPINHNRDYPIPNKSLQVFMKKYQREE